MEYMVEIVDRDGVRVARIPSVPLMEVACGGPDENDRIEGLLPVTLERFGVGYTVRVYLDGRLVTWGTVIEVGPAWGDVRRLIADQYVNFQELLSFIAVREWGNGNRRAAARFENARVDDMVRGTINRARGPVHYTVAHDAYPDGAVREYEKFAARMAVSDPLPAGGIDSGQWVDAWRIDATAAYAKDGDTVAGLVVDGEAWPDLRLMLIDCEETSLNSHAISRHPEVADWDATRYARSVYGQRAAAATERLQELIDTKGFDLIELNPHQDASGTYDDRVDAYGRYIGLIFGSGECFNAALVEDGLADVYLYEDGRYHVPEMALKDFFSYTGVHEDSIAACTRVVGAFENRGGLLEALTALTAFGDGYVFHLGADRVVRFRPGWQVDSVVELEPVRLGVSLGHTTDGMANLLRIVGNPADGTVDDYHADDDSIDALGTAFRYFAYFALRNEADAAQLGQGLLRDLAWPTRVGRVLFYRGVSTVDPGALLEFRGDALVERDPPVGAAWTEDLGGRFVGRVRRVVHRVAGDTVETQLDLTSPYRSVAAPLTFITRSQDSLSAFFEFRLDDEVTGLDAGYHLD